MNKKPLLCYRWYLLRGFSLVLILGLLVGCASTSKQSPTSKPAPSAIYISPGGQGTIRALRASNGTSLWQYQNPDQSVVNSMTEVNGVIYALIGYKATSSNASSGILEALRARDGRLLWRFQGTNIDQGPIVESGVVYVTTENQQHSTLTALRATDGLVLWSSQLHLDAGANLTTVSVVDGMVYVVSQVEVEMSIYTDGTVSALRASDGKFLWQYRPDNGKSAPLALLAADGKVAVGASNEDLNYSTVSLLKSEDGSVLWQYRETNGTLEDLLALQENLLYLDIVASSDQQHYHNVILALRVKDGSVAWSYQLTGRTSEATLVIHHDILYVGSWPDTFADPFGQKTSGNALLALQTSNGKLLWQRPFPDLNFITSQLTVTDQAIYINDQTHAPQSGEIRAVQIKDGSPLWSQQIPKGPVSLLSVEGHVVYAGIRGIPTEGQQEEDPWNGGEMCAYQAVSGKTIWCQQTSYSILSFILG